MMNNEIMEITKDSIMEMEENQAYKQRLRELPEVKKLTKELNVTDSNSILSFGEEPSTAISKTSDKLLSSMKGTAIEDTGEMLKNLTKIMDRFDSKELQNPIKRENFIQKLFHSASSQIEKLFKKYDDMGKEVDKIYLQLKDYEQDIKKTNNDLVMQYNENVKYFQQLEQYIVAGDLILEQLEEAKVKLEENTEINPQEQNDKLNRLNTAKEMVSQRIYDLKIAENVAMQTCPMIQTMQLSNFNLLRKINSSFMITLPIFKQCLVQAIQLKKQEIQAKSIQQLDEKTNELLLRNAQNTVSQSINIAKMTGGSSIKIETLQETYETIKNGIEETKQITSEMAAKRLEDEKVLGQMKIEMKENGYVSNV